MQVDLTQKTIDAVVDVLKSGPAGTYVPGSGLVQKDVTTATGLVAYNLEAPAKLLQPVITPLRNRIFRKGGGMGTAAEWKVINSLDTNRVDLFTGEGLKAATVNITVVPKTAGFRTLSKGDNNTFQSQWAGRGFEDVKARNITRLLSHVMIMEEQAIIGADTTLAAPAAPTVVVNDGTGTVADATLNVFVRAVTNVGRGRKSTATSTGAIANGNDSSLSCSVAYVDGAVEYQWFVGTAGAERLEATTRINSAHITALAGTGALLSATADNHTDALAFEGLIRQITAGGTVVTLPTGTAGTGTAFSMTYWDTLCQTMWDTWKAWPQIVLVNSAESISITNAVLAANGGPTLYMTNDPSELGKLTGGYRATALINKVTGFATPIIVHPYLKPGTLLAPSFDMPFPASDINNVIEIETRQEYLQIDYPLTAPKWEYEILVDEVLKVFFPGGCGIIRNINGV